MQHMILEELSNSVVIYCTIGNCNGVTKHLVGGRGVPAQGQGNSKALQQPSIPSDLNVS